MPPGSQAFKNKSQGLKPSAFFRFRKGSGEGNLAGAAGQAWTARVADRLAGILERAFAVQEEECCIRVNQRVP